MNFNRKQRSFISAVLFLSPALIIYSVFRLVPAIASLYYGFTDWNGLSNIFHFVGLKNYYDIFKDNFVLSSLKNTAIYAVIVTVLQNVLGLLFAIMLEDNKIKGFKFFRTVLFLPSIISTSAICFMWSIILNPVLGVSKNILDFLGLTRILGTDLLGQGSTALITVAAVNIWQFTGYSMLIYLAGLQSVPQELYEAADMDGCGRLNKLLHVTLPMIGPSITINVILTTIGSLKEFEHIFILTNGGPGNASQVVGTAIYKVAFGDTQQFGYGIAISTVLLVAIIIINAVQLYILQRREVTY
jgi:raffinose/stachyose/melibiose transport system permease protein